MLKISLFTLLFLFLVGCQATDNVQKNNEITKNSEPRVVVQTMKPLYENEYFGLEIFNNNLLNQVKTGESNRPNNKFLSFQLNRRNILATSLLYKDEVNSYPITEKFGDAFIKKTYQNREYSVLLKTQITSEFLNRKILGQQYIVEVTQDDVKRCELVIIQNIGNRSYMFLTINDHLWSSGSCLKEEEELRHIYKSIIESINVSKT